MSRSLRAGVPLPAGRPAQGRWGRVCVVGAVCAGLLAGAVTSAYLADDSAAGADAGSVVVGPFAVSDGFEASVDERDGSVRFGVPVAGLGLAWDSRAAGVGDDESEFGAGWGLGFARVSTAGGLTVQVPGGGSYEADASHPSGLSGYGVGDVRFEQRRGELPGREIVPGVGLPGQPNAVGYAFVLHELGGTVSYYAESGALVARVSGLGERTDWVRNEATGRLLSVVSPDGIVTRLDWEDPGVVLVTPGANLPGEVDPVTGETRPVPMWRVELDGGRVGAVVDPVGGRFQVRYDRVSSLVTGVAGPSGGSTQLEWQAFPDGTARVARVRAVDADGAEVSVREWAPAGDGTPSSGWPEFGGEGEWFRSGSAARYETAMTDGATRVVSAYNSQHRLVGRRMVVSSAAGERVLQEQEFAYPGTEGGEVPDPAALPGNWSRPTATTITHHDTAGQTRMVSESTEYDELGRQVSRTAADRTVTTTEYDEVVPPGGLLPVGVPVTQTVTAPDGLIEQTRRELDGTRTGVIASETWRGRAGEELTRVGRSEFDLAADGMVTRQRVYPAGDPAADPVVTAWDRVVDLGTGTMSSTTTVAVGTPAEASAIEVSSLRHGGVLASTDPAGTTVRAGFDGLGRPRVGIDPSGNVSTQEFETAQDGGRNATVTTGVDEVVVTEVRDTIGRVTRILDNIDHGVTVPGFTRVVETRAYPEPGTTVVTDAWGASTTTRQDIFGRETETVGPTGLVKVVEHDDVTDQTMTGVSTTGELADAEQVTIETRDAVDRVASVSGERRDGVPIPELTSRFDGFGRATSTTDGTLDTGIEYDVHGNPATTTLTPLAASERADLTGAGQVTASRRFDGFGASLEKTLTGVEGDSRSGGAREVDVLGRTLTETDQVGRDTTIEYTKDGLVSRVDGGSGQVTVYDYDPVTRQLVQSTITSPIGARVTTGYVFDSVTGRVTGVFDPGDRAGTEIRYEHDAHGNPVRVRYPDGNQIEYEYDAHGRNTTTTDVAGNVTTRTHTQEGLPVRAEQHDAEGVLLGEMSSEYDELGRLTRLSRGNGVVTDYAFTSASEIARETTTDPAGTVLADRVYTYDPRGNLVGRSDTTRDGPGSEPEITVTSYGYDAFDRLVSSRAETAGTTVREAEYELTVSGDIRAETITDTDPGTGVRTTTTREFDYSPLGELDAQTVTTSSSAEPGLGVVTRTESSYDGAGNLTRAIDGAQYAYDAANRPIRHATPDGHTTATEYWADGSRRAMTRESAEHGTSTVGFYWDGDTLLNDTHTSATPGGTGVAAYLIGASRHARTVSGASDETEATSWYGTDRHGNVTELTDASGAVAERYTYTDYGEQSRGPLGERPESRAELTRNPFGYAGEYTDPDGTQYLRTRLYDPGTMRFTTMDTAALHNLYAYADLNPITRIDPTGRAGEVDWFSIINGVLIGVSIVAAFSGIGSVLSMARTVALARSFAWGGQLVRRSFSALAGQSAVVDVGTVSTVDKLVAGFNVVFDLGNAAVGATILSHEKIEAIADDPAAIDALMWTEGALTLFSGGAAGYLGVKQWVKNSRLSAAFALDKKLASTAQPVSAGGQPLLKKRNSAVKILVKPPIDLGGGRPRSSSMSASTASKDSKQPQTRPNPHADKPDNAVCAEFGVACLALRPFVGDESIPYLHELILKQGSLSTAFFRNNVADAERIVGEMGIASKWVFTSPQTSEVRKLAAADATRDVAGYLNDFTRRVDEMKKRTIVIDK